MKKLIFSFVFSISCFIGKAQTNVYHPFPDSNAIWIGTSWYIVSLCGVSDDYNLYISGDTTLGKYSYHKLYVNGHKYATCPPPGFFYYGQYWGAFRQDSANKKIYLFQNGADKLAYDFNLNVGDTLPNTCLSGPQNWNYVQSIDSVLIGSEYHKRFWLRDNYAALIEGIGSTLGAFAQIVPPFESGKDLWCMRINNQIVWTNGGVCALTSITENSITENKTVIYPNPFSLTTTIKITDNCKNASLIIYNSIGQQVKEIKTISEQEIKLQRDNLPNGFYFIRFSKDSKTIATDKLIITD